MRKKYISLLLLILFVSAPSSAQKALTILQTSDVHSRIEPMSQKGDRDYNKGGFIRRATFLKEFRKTNPEMLLFDCGDFSQGTPYYNLFKGEIEINLMNEMKYDVVTIGNHEFDNGLDNMARIFKMADFPIVCANYNFDATVLKGLVKPYVILNHYGLKIGVFGIGTQLEGMVQKSKCKGVIYSKPVPVANKMAALLRAKGCDLVICLSHIGITEDTAMIPQTHNIDIVFGGHSHTFLRRPKFISDADGKKIPLIHTGCNGIYVGRLDLTLTH